MIFSRSLDDVFTKLAQAQPAAKAKKPSKLDAIFSTHSLSGLATAVPTALALRYVFKRQKEKQQEIINQSIRHDIKAARAVAIDFAKKNKLGKIPVKSINHPQVISGFAAYDPKTKKPVILNPKNKSKSKAQISDPIVYLHELGHAKGMAKKNPITRAAAAGMHPVVRLASTPLALINRPAHLGLTAAAQHALVAEEHRASSEAMKYIARHGSQQEKIRAKRLLRALHEPYVSDAIDKVITPSILIGAFAHGYLKSLNRDREANLLRIRRDAPIR